MSWNGLEECLRILSSGQRHNPGECPNTPRRLPKLNHDRVLTPLHVSHQLEIDVRFSVHAEDAAGKRLHVIGPGELRVLRISRQTVMPSVSLIASFERDRG